MSLKTELISTFEKMESERQDLLKTLSAIPAASLSKKPQPNAWSVAEVVTHLVAAESGSLKYLRIKLEHGGHKKAAMSSTVKQKLLNLAISLPIKFKAPKVTQIQEDSEITFAEAVAKWSEVRKEMRSEYTALDENIVGNELFKHPSAGKMNIVQGAKFMRQHMNRHIKQIHRTIKQVS